MLARPTKSFIIPNNGFICESSDLARWEEQIPCDNCCTLLVELNKYYNDFKAADCHTRRPCSRYDEWLESHPLKRIPKEIKETKAFEILDFYELTNWKGNNEIKNEITNPIRLK